MNMSLITKEDYEHNLKNTLNMRIIYLKISTTPIRDSKIVELVFRCRQGYKLISLGSRNFRGTSSCVVGKRTEDWWSGSSEQRICHIYAFQNSRSCSSAVVLQSSSLKSARRREKFATILCKRFWCQYDCEEQSDEFHEDKLSYL